MKKDISKTLAWVFAIITCPCNLFILFGLLVGTAAGSFVQHYFLFFLVGFFLLFIVSLRKALKE